MLAGVGDGEIGRWGDGGTRETKDIINSQPPTTNNQQPTI
jgi:hypothetical protein